MVALEVLSGVAGLDPDFIGLKADIAQFQTPLTDGLPRTPAARAWTRLFGSLEYAYERIIFVPWLIRGGADLVAVHAARGAIERHGPQSLLFVVTDSARMDAADWLPQDAHIRVLSDFGPDLTHQDRVELVAWLIQALEPRSILNVNSAACWEAIKAKGAALSSFCDLYATLFCRDYNAEGEAAGYADLYVRATARHLKAIYFDNAAFTRELAAQFALPRSLKTRLRVVYQPIQGPVQTIDALDPGAPPSVLWAGRLCRQKNVELLVRIARAAPGFQFDVYGSGEPTYEAIAAEASRSLGNLTCHGVYSSFDVIPTQSFGSFLYTTHFDGLPNVLLAAAAAGLPIVAPAIGGIGELVDADTGWLVADTDNPDAYIAALEDIRRYPEETLRRVSAMRERILTRHAWSQYMNSMLISPSFLQD
jgi:glycosyltransferase involved in cell wall biosynthesis